MTKIVSGSDTPLLGLSYRNTENCRGTVKSYMQEILDGEIAMGISSSAYAYRLHKGN